MDISTHAPLARCDWLQILLFRRQLPFLLTHLLRGATRGQLADRPPRLNFYSRTSCEVRQRPAFQRMIATAISTHAPLARCDVHTAETIRAARARFLLTHLLRGATPSMAGYARHATISTHVPLARCDSSAQLICFSEPTFLLTHLLRGATYTLSYSEIERRFLLTHLLRGATKKWGYTPAEVMISTHAPLARCDWKK